MRENNDSHAAKTVAKNSMRQWMKKMERELSHLRSKIREMEQREEERELKAPFERLDMKEIEARLFDNTGFVD